jgi:hypothetical protein
MLKKMEQLEDVLGDKPKKADEEDEEEEGEDEDEEYMLGEEELMMMQQMEQFDETDPNFAFVARKRKMMLEAERGVGIKKRRICNLFMQGKCPRVSILFYHISRY